MKASEAQVNILTTVATLRYTNLAKIKANARGMKMKLQNYLIVFIFLVYAQYCPAHNEPGRNRNTFKNSNSDSTEIQKQTVQSIKQRFGPDVIIRMDVKSNGVINGLLGKGLNKGLTETDPQRRALQFLELNKDLFLIENPKEQLQIANTDPATMGTHSIYIEQVEKGLKVFGGSYVFNFIKDSDGIPQITGFIGNFRPMARGMNTTPSISAEQAVQIAMGDSVCQGKNPSLSRDPWLYIREFNRQLKLVWYFSLKGINSCESNKYFFIIDAQNGKVLWAGCYNEMPG
jgi:Zn-dependent metalloprotease